MKFYHVSDGYIVYLKKFDEKVAENKCENRPYVGIVIQVDEIKYYAPFTSPKDKHKKMKNGKDFRKIKGGTYGAINFNNMIPVPDNVLIPIDINNETDVKYRRLLQNQYKAIAEDSASIIKTAERLRQLILTENDKLTAYDKQIKERCCNLQVLEDACSQYENKNKE